MWTRRVLGNRVIANRATARFMSTAQARMVTPDQTTSVDVHEHKLKRPERKKKQWVGLDGLKARTSGSLVPDTLAAMEGDDEFKITAQQLRKQGQKKLTLAEKKLRRRALHELGVPDFKDFCTENDKLETLDRVATEVLQINIGLYCNQACNHCHVESSPKRKEMMSREVVERCLVLLENSPSITTVDITGGAPELNENFRYLVEGATALGREVIDRCNLTVLQEPGQEDLAQFLKQHKVRVVASLPCYSLKNVDSQRGKGVFDRSIQGLLDLNKLGYGTDPDLGLDLVYNPLGGFLPPEQSALEAKYTEELKEHFGIVFNNLFCFTNMPIKRFADFLHRRGELKNYMDLLVRNFNPHAVDQLMCRNYLSVSWTGMLYDCDFNQQIDMDIGEGVSIFDIDNTADLLDSEIALDSHCYGCTAGAGSS